MHPEDYPPVELSPDIEWLMLNSQRGDPERVLALVSLLVENVGRAALWTALEMLSSPEFNGESETVRELARKAAAEGLLRVVAQGQRYQTGIDLAAWTCQAVFEVIWEGRRAWKVDDFFPQPYHDETVRLGVLFQEKLGLPPNTVGNILGRQTESARIRLIIVDDPWREEDADRLVQLAAKADRAETRNLEVVRAKQITPVSFAEVSVVMVALVGVILVTWGLNLINPESAKPLVLDVLTPHPLTPTPSPDWQATADARDRIPLDENSTVAQIQDRARFYNSVPLWADFSITYFGAQGYDGQPIAWRMAYWSDMGNNRLMAAIGPPTEPPYYIYGTDFSVELQKGIVRGQLRGPQAAVLMGFEHAFFHTDGSPTQSVNEAGLFEDLDATPLPGLEQVVAIIWGYTLSDSPEIYEKLPVQHIAGQTAVGFATLDAAGNILQETYIDPVYGMLLLMNTYSRNHPGVLIRQIRVNRILFEVPFPSQFYEPEFPILIGYQPDPVSIDSQPPEWTPDWQSGPPIAPEPVPEGYDLAKAVLSFQYRLITSEEYPLIYRLRIYAGAYWLGDIPTLQDPFYNVTCNRSQDGRKLAFEGVYGPFPENTAAGVTWYDLDKLSKATRQYRESGLVVSGQDYSHIVFLPVPPDEKKVSQDVYYPGSAITGMAFSPDGSHLAILTSQWQNPQPGDAQYSRPGGVYIADLATGVAITGTQVADSHVTARLIAKLVDGKSLVWSPDGKQVALIAMISNPNRQNPSGISTVEEIWVLDVATGDLIYHEPLDLLNGRPLGNWPMDGWNVPFPVDTLEGLEGCVSVPVP